ncbi:MAG: redoxin domain-containing protein [Alphaproteobacteria bacterium]|nr:redoxin domain-containing protein [Alphaproteobacteria bacterium]
MRFALLLLVGGCAPHLYTAAPTDGAWAWDSPTNRWTVTAPPEGTRGQGFGVGQVVPDARLFDQYGEEVSLWQFHGRVVILDVSTMWCAPCQDLAQGTQSTIDAFAQEPFAYITVLQENVESREPTIEDLGLWAENFDIEGPVLGDGAKTTAGAVVQGQYPAVLLIGPDLTVVERVNPPTDEEVHNAVESALAEL